LPPANSDDDPEAILKKNNWNRSQLINHHIVWNHLGPTVPKSDLDQLEDGAIETIVNNKDVSLLSEYHDQSLYVILGLSSWP